MGIRRKVVESDEGSTPEEDEDKLEEPVPRQPAKRVSKPSEKVQHAGMVFFLIPLSSYLPFPPLDKENLKKAEQQLAKLKKHIAKMKKTRSSKDAEEEEDMGIESEDPDEENIMFSSSITPLEPIVMPQAGTTRIHCVDLSKEIATTKVPRQTVTATSSSAGHSPSGNAASVQGDDNEQSFVDDGSQQLSSLPLSRNKRPHSPASTETALLGRAKKSWLQVLPVILRPSLNLAAVPILSDFSDLKVQTFLMAAIREYETLICTKASFPSLPLRAQWAESCWANAQKDAPKNDDGLVLCYEFTGRMLHLIKKCRSCIRGDLLTPTRAQVMSCYGFHDGRKAQDMKRNAKNVSSLLQSNSFHYKEPKTQTGYCGNPAILNMICATWFKDLKSAGVIFNNYFNPISIETLALVFTLISHCISEWKTGKHIHADFSENDVKKSHQAFHADLDKWHNLNIVVTTNKRKKMFHANAGLVDTTAPQPQLTGDAEEHARKELEGHTGETDSEADDGSGSSDNDDP